jgi:threonine/homoserine/homoserine lactone efflux protein
MGDTTYGIAALKYCSRVMGDAIGQVLSLGVGVAISPVPIIAVVLMLSTQRGRANGPAFILGWVVGLSVVGAIVLLVSSGADASESGEPATWVSVLKLVIGLLLLLVAVREWRGRPRGDADVALPGWMRTIDRFTPQRSLAMGVALSAINPKNLLLTVGAAASIAHTGIGAGQQAIALAVFVLVGTLGPGLPVAIYFLMGERAARILDDLKNRMGHNNAAIIAVICLVIGAKLIGDGISAL